MQNLKAVILLSGDRKSFLHFRLKLLWMLLPFAFGFIGYMIYYDHDVLFSLFSTVRIYTASFDMTYASLVEWVKNPSHTPQLMYVMRTCLEVARWLGLCVTATFLSKLLKVALKRGQTRYNALHRDAIALHGSTKFCQQLASSIHGRTLVDDLPEKFSARRHILAFETDRELFAYLTAHFHQLSPHADTAQKSDDGRSVYLCFTAPLQTHYDNRGFIINNMSEDCARIYWHKLYARRFSDHPDRCVVIIGFGTFGQALLKQALLTNVFVEPAEMEYHIFGDSADYQRRHSGLTGFASINQTQLGRDAVFYHSEPWTDNLTLLLRADRIILADDREENNLLTLADIKENNTVTHVHLRTSDTQLVQALWPGHCVAEYDPTAEICVFGTDQSLYTRRIIMDEALILAAKCINAQYMRRIGKSTCSTCRYPETLAECARNCKSLDADWQSLSLFLQEANLSQADHIPVKLRQVLRQDCEISNRTLTQYRERYAQMTQEGGMEPFFRLEHKRWMRHHYYYNWEYASVRDDPNRQHPMMVPYDQLSELQKPKDKDPYAMIPELAPVIVQAME